VGFVAALAPSANRQRAQDFPGTELMPGANRAVVQERDRQPLAGSLPGNGFQLIVDVLSEFGSRARVATWRLDLRRVGDAGADGEWAIADEERISSVENIYKVVLKAMKAFTARNLRVSAEDLDLTLIDGSMYVAEIDLGVTGVVLLGRGTVNFH